MPPIFRFINTSYMYKQLLFTQTSVIYLWSFKCPWTHFTKLIYMYPHRRIPTCDRVFCKRRDHPWVSHDDVSYEWHLLYIYYSIIKLHNCTFTWPYVDICKMSGRCICVWFSLPNLSSVFVRSCILENICHLNHLSLIIKYF